MGSVIWQAELLGRIDLQVDVLEVLTRIAGCVPERSPWFQIQTGGYCQQLPMLGHERRIEQGGRRYQKPSSPRLLPGKEWISSVLWSQCNQEASRIHQRAHPRSLQWQ